jgi:molybdopterin-guanine dinucleotide biosynthesis protein A
LRSGVILAGGRSSRLGVPKALLELGGEPLLRHVARALAPSCDELLVVAAPPAAQSAELREGLARELRLLARRWPQLHGAARPHRLRPRVRLIHDQRPHLGPASGIASALAAARGTTAFVAACDVPFLAPQLVAALFARAEAAPQVDVVVPRWNGYLEPLATVYRTERAAAHYAVQIDDGELKPTARFALLVLDVIDEPAIRALDPQGRSFTNLNAPADYAAARALVDALPTAPAPRPGRSRRGSSADE